MTNYIIKSGQGYILVNEVKKRYGKERNRQAAQHQGRGTQKRHAPAKAGGNPQRSG